MNKMWAGRTDGVTSRLADDFNSSIGIDCRMAEQDIKGSLAHTAMLAKQGIITEDDAAAITAGLKGILSDIKSGALEIDPAAEDIHMFVESVLTERIGDAGKRLHTARSRNDQVALDFRLYLMDDTDEITELIRSLAGTIADVAEKYKSVVMAGYTHLQRAQPILFSHHLLAYAFMLLRDAGRFADCRRRIAVSPIGCCALAGTTYDTDRVFEAGQLGLPEICMNSIDGVSDRDFCIEFLSALSITQMHLSRLAEEMIIWSSGEFGYITISDEYTTGSSIMPQKKNPDMAELIRGKTGRVYGDLFTLLTLMKGLPLAYDKDMQEDKEGVFDAADTVKKCLEITIPMLAGMKVNAEAMRESAGKGFINATDLADYLVVKGMPFREAYKISGRVVHECTLGGYTLETFPLDKYQAYSPLFDEGVYKAVDLDECVSRRNSLGGTSPENVEKQIEIVRNAIKIQ